jgi:hypothetical protein
MSVAACPQVPARPGKPLLWEVPNSILVQVIWEQGAATMILISAAPFCSLDADSAYRLAPFQKRPMFCTLLGKTDLSLWYTLIVSRYIDVASFDFITACNFDVNLTNLFVQIAGPHVGIFHVKHVCWRRYCLYSWG